MSKTYLQIGDEQQGPYSGEEIRVMLSEGKITAQTLHWEEGMPGWKPLKEKPSRLLSQNTIVPPRRQKDTPLVVDFKNAHRNRNALSARTKPITLGKALAIFVLLFLLVVGVIEIFGHFLPDAAAEFAERTGELPPKK